MDINKSLDKVFGRLSDIQLAILIDVTMLVPFVDFLVTVPLQYYLWSRLDSQTLMYINMGYDLVADFAIPVVGDFFPLNTVCVIGAKLLK